MLTDLQETALRRLLTQFNAESEKGRQVHSLIAVWRQADKPTIDWQQIAELGNLPPLPKRQKSQTQLYQRRLVKNHVDHVVVYGGADAIKPYKTLAEQSSLTIGLKPDLFEWTRLLFALAWRSKKYVGTTLQSDRWTVRCGMRIEKPTEDLPKGHSVTQLFESAFDGAEPFTASTLPNLFLASVAAIELFLTNVIEPPTGKTVQGEGAKRADLAPKKLRKRKRKADSKTAKNQEERKARHAIEKAIADDWNRGEWDNYQDYVMYKN